MDEKQMTATNCTKMKYGMCPLLILRNKKSIIIRSCRTKIIIATSNDNKSLIILHESYDTIGLLKVKRNAKVETCSSQI